MSTNAPQTDTEARLDAAIAGLPSMDPAEANLVITRLLGQLAAERRTAPTPRPVVHASRAARTRKIANDRGWGCAVAEPAARVAAGVS